MANALVENFIVGFGVVEIIETDFYENYDCDKS